MLHLRGPTGEGPQRGPPARGRLLLPGTPLHAHCSCRARSSGNAHCAPREAVSAQAPSLVLSRFFQHRAWRGVFMSRGGSRAAAAMAEEASATAPAPAAAAVAGEGRMMMVVAVDDSEHSFYALQWALQHFFAPGQGLPQLYRLAVLTAKPTAASVVGLAGPGAADVLPLVEADLKRSSMRVIDKAKELCAQSQVSDAVFEVAEGDARNVLCDAVERHHAEMLVVGSHGYGAIKRAVLGSVSDYCAHHAHCTVMIVKKPSTSTEIFRSAPV